MRRFRLGIRVEVMRRLSSCAGVVARGGRYPVGAPTGAVSAALRLRCDARVTRAAAVPPSAALEALRTSRRPRRSAVCGAGLPLAPLRFSPPHKSPPPGTARRAEALVAVADEYLGAAGKAVGGQAPARMVGAEQHSDPRGIATRAGATRRRACRAPSAAALRSSVAAARGRGAEPPLGREQRRGPRPAGPRRRRLSAGACPPTALLARFHAGACT